MADLQYAGEYQIKELLKQPFQSYQRPTAEAEKN